MFPPKCHSGINSKHFTMAWKSPHDINSAYLSCVTSYWSLLSSVFKRHRTISCSKNWPLSPKRFSFAEIFFLFGVFGTLLRCHLFCNDFPDVPQACSLVTLELLIYMLLQNLIYAFTVTLPSIRLSYSFTPVSELLEGIFKCSAFYAFGPWQGLLKE